MNPSADQAKQDNEAAVFRQTLRRERIRAREALSVEDHAYKSSCVEANLFALLSQRAPALLAFYWPIRAEIDCRPLVARLRPLGWHACLPVVSERQAPLQFRAWEPHTPLADDEYGIPTVIEGPWLTPEVLLMPVNAFDNAGYRLGYGGGYFDRTLAALRPRPFAIGVGFDLARVDSIQPHAQDLALDAVATESGIVLFGK